MKQNCAQYMELRYQPQKNWKSSATKAQQILKILVRKATSAMFQNKNLKRNANSAIAEVAEVAPLRF